MGENISNMYLKSVEKFHRTFNHPVLDSPTIPSQDRCKLRVDLLTEELKELQEAIEAKDIVEIADALCDIQYVLSGAVLEFGLGEKFKTLFEEVQRSNMSKACSNIEEAEKTVRSYLKKGIATFYEQVGDYYIVYRKSDRKILKSINYSPANLKI